MLTKIQFSVSFTICVRYKISDRFRSFNVLSVVSPTAVSTSRIIFTGSPQLRASLAQTAQWQGLPFSLHTVYAYGPGRSSPPCPASRTITGRFSVCAAATDTACTAPKTEHTKNVRAPRKNTTGIYAILKDKYRFKPHHP